jgi:hypothetical protein
MNSSDKLSKHDSDTGTSPLFVSGHAKGSNILNGNLKERLVFLRNIYGIITTQLGLTAIMSVTFIETPTIQEFFYTQ